MLEPIEPANHSDSGPGDTLPPRRRRRAASRPAGPPSAGETTAQQSVTVPAAEAQPDAPAPAAEAPAATEAPATPARPRRRATRKATAPAGAPRAAEPVAEEALEVPAATADAAVAADSEPAEDAKPARTRRRATRKATAPAGAPKAAETVAEAPVTAEPAEIAEMAEPEAPAAETAPPARTRRRATRKATAPAGSPQAAETVVETPAPAAEAEAEVEEEELEAVEEIPAPAPRTRRRATRKATAPAGSPQAAEAPAEAAPAAAAEEEAPVAETRGRRTRRRAAGTEEAAEAAPARTRGRRQVATGDAEAAAAALEAAKAESRAREAATETPAEPAEAPARGRRRAVRPPTAVFQAPVFTEPMFQTPETAAAAAAATVPAEEPEEEQAERAAEAAQPAAGGRRRRRRRGEPAEAEQAVAEETVPAVEEPEAEEADEAEAAHDEEESDRPSRRRRRGGRRRRRGEAGEPEAGTAEEESAEAEAEAEAAEEEQEEAYGEEPGAGSAGSRRRRRRRRRSGDAAEAEVAEGDPERTVVKVREPRKREEREPGTGFDEVQSIKGSTRMEAKKQRRREGREQGRRRVPIITEAEFLARREAVERVMVVRQSGERTQIGVLEDNVLVEHYVNKEQATSYVGNVYLGKVQNVLPSMEAAFVDIGKGRNAVLYAGEVNFEALGMGNGPRRIETALKSGQSVLVQVTKDPIGHKGARLTSQVSLPGRYLVYVPEGSMTGISRKLPDTERARLKQILKKIVPEDAGVIVRTAAEGASEDELARDVQRLQAQWEEIQKKAKSGNAPTLLYGEPDMTVRVVRDIFNEDFSKVIVSGEGAWETIHGYVSHVAPDLTDRLQKWTSDVDVFATYRIDEQLMKALDRKVWLPSGGSLVIDRTEAMVVVDVNTGKFTGQGGNLEETVTKNNLEAAEEIVRQLRLRDLGGIVVIDFIDMVLEANRDLVLRRLLECLGRDRTKHQVAEVTSLGLVQMTRKRVGQGLLESFSESCVHCNGRGVIVHMDQPTSVGGGGGGKRAKKKGKAQPHEHEHVTAEAVEPAEAEAEAEAPELEPVTVTEAELQPSVGGDEEWFGSPAEARAAAGSRGGRTRRRATRKATAPAGSPKAAEPEIVVEPAPAPAPVAEPE
ncbi:Rne/Rng family ribonuclease, partial [Streptomyces sp. NPDC020667]|uniref:Rne/Rng family ribonuclease n=1 Tax=Streptomyces sp. NPDC020667 TaxID=3154895 RepID=UPI003402996D